MHMCVWGIPQMEDCSTKENMCKCFVVQGEIGRTRCVYAPSLISYIQARGLI